MNKNQVLVLVLLVLAVLGAAGVLFYTHMSPGETHATPEHALARVEEEAAVTSGPTPQPIEPRLFGENGTTNAEPEVESPVISDNASVSEKDRFNANIIKNLQMYGIDTAGCGFEAALADPTRHAAAMAVFRDLSDGLLSVNNRLSGEGARVSQAYFHENQARMKGMSQEEYIRVRMTMLRPATRIVSHAYYLCDLAVVGDDDYHAKYDELMREQEKLCRLFEAFAREL